MSTKHAKDKIHNRDCLLRILSSLRFPGGQGLPNGGDGDEADENYIQLLIVYLTVTLNLKNQLTLIPPPDETYRGVEIVVDILVVVGGVSVERGCGRHLKNSYNACKIS